MASTIYQLRTFDDLVDAAMEALKFQASDTVSRNRIKRDINTIYLNEVVPYHTWKWLDGQVNLVLDAAYETDECAVTQNSTTVTLETAPAYSRKGDLFMAADFDEVYTIAEHTANSTTVTLSTPYTGSTNAAVAFKIFSYKLPLPVDCRQTVQVRSDFNSLPLEGMSLQEFESVRHQNPGAEARPAAYTTADYADASSYETISGLPASVSRSSDGLMKTIVLASTVAAYLEEGDRIRISGAGHYSYNGEFVVRSVSTTTVTFVGSIPYYEASTADVSVTLKLESAVGSSERYRQLLVWPSAYTSKTTLHVSYIKDPSPLQEDGDEPLMPLSDRSVLLYGALMQAWSRAGDPQEAARNATLYERKLSKMMGKFDDSQDTPILRPSRGYLGAKRNSDRRRPSYGAESFGSGASAGAGVIHGTANQVAVFNASGELTQSALINQTELNQLDGILSSAVGISDTQTLTNKTIDSDLNTITNIVNADIKAAAAIDATKIANGSVTNAEFQHLTALTDSLFDVTYYGAVGNGSTDDTTAIQAAMDALETAGGGILRFTPNKTYKVTSTLNFNASKALIQGNNATLAPNMSSSITLMIEGSGASQITDIRLENLRFITTSTASTSGSQQAIQLNHAQRVTIENCYIKDFAVGIKANANVQYFWGIGNKFKNIGEGGAGSGGICIYAEGEDGGVGYETDHIYMLHNYADGFVYAWESKFVSDVIIANNICENSTLNKFCIGVARDDGSGSAASRAVVANNIVRNCSEEGIFVKGNNIIVANNVVENATTNGIRATGSNITVSNNAIYGAAVAMSLVYDANGSTEPLIFDTARFIVTGNNMKNITSTDPAVNCNTLSDSIIANNTMYDRTGAGYCFRLDGCVGTTFINNSADGGTYGFRYETNSTGCTIRGNKSTGASISQTSIPSAHLGWTIEDGDLQLRSFPRVQTTDAVQTTLGAFTLPNTQSALQIKAKVTCKSTSGTGKLGAWDISALVFRAGGGAGLSGSVGTTFVSTNDATMDATFTVSGNDVRVSVTGVAATNIVWQAEVEIIRRES